MISLKGFFERISSRFCTSFVEVLRRRRIFPPVIPSLNKTSPLNYPKQTNRPLLVSPRETWDAARRCPGRWGKNACGGAEPLDDIAGLKV